MADWKDAIRLTIKDKQDAQSADETRRQAAAVAANRQNADNASFLKDVARPALEEIRAELASHGVDCKLSDTTADVGLEVSEKGRIRFSYRVSGNGDACIRASGGSASISAIPFQGGARTGEDIKRHFGAEFRSLFSGR